VKIASAPVKRLSVNKALEEISAIERLIRPYEYEAYEARNTLNDLASLREALSRMNKESIRSAVERILTLEAYATPYRDFGPVEEALQHARRLREELKKLLKS